HLSPMLPPQLPQNLTLPKTPPLLHHLPKPIHHQLQPPKTQPHTLIHHHNPTPPQLTPPIPKIHPVQPNLHNPITLL
ncbi:hypothetical protein, partial [Staphylococcus hominis]|uniref:hypothetical protein n=1 Tax=Staphylococcus hominis TaxID=1290 RepID=UPI0021B5B631